MEIVLGLQEDRESKHGLGLLNIHENAKMQHWANARRKKQERLPRSSLFGARPDAGTGTGNIGSLSDDNPGVPGQAFLHATWNSANIWDPSGLFHANPSGTNASGKTPSAGTGGLFGNYPSGFDASSNRSNNCTPETEGTPRTYEEFLRKHPAERPKRPFRGTAANCGVGPNQ